MNHAFDFDDLFYRLRYWTTKSDGVHCTCTPIDLDIETDNIVVPYAVFAAIHPDLPEAIRHIHRDRSAAWGDDQLGPSLLEAQVHHFQSPWTVTTCSGDAHWVSRLRSLRWVAEDVVKVRASTYTLSTTLAVTLRESAATVKPFVDNVSAIVLSISPKQLDTRYPGWRDRFAAADALGLDEDDRLEYACPAKPSNPIHPTSLAMVNFE